MLSRQMAISECISSFLGMSNKSLELEYSLDVYPDTQRNVDIFPLLVLLHLVGFLLEALLRLRLSLVPVELAQFLIGSMDTHKSSLLRASPSRLVPKVYRKLFHI